MSAEESFERASKRFRAFFAELGERFIERDDVLRQISLALLAKEHVLVAGPPGTAKSQLAAAVFGRILCEDSGAPSLFSRQITESTIQTDLVGPIDFKNLMETGRTAHFTDEGILGSAHAFLDEIFDGRDMLLRSALNVLQERELKQGATVTRGRVECALMTSNRYVADVVESSHGNLLAFVDRVAFLGFVPRGFASPRSAGLLLRRVMGGSASPPLDALLTLQDLDVLQAATDEVWIDDAICDAVADLVARLDVELAQAVRADPEFHPTRYLSARTTVRCGRVLRAAVIHDAIVRRPDRPREVQPVDLESLRHYLVLNGPTPAEVDALLAREVDPKERRQLAILKTERQIVDRCIAQAKKGARPPAARPQAVRAGATPASTPDSLQAPVAPPPDDPRAGQIADLASRVSAAEARGDLEGVLAALRAMAPLARGGDAIAKQAEGAVQSAAAALARSAIRRALEASVFDSVSPLGAAEGLASVVIALDDDSASLHRVVQGLAASALALVDRVLAFPLTPTSADLGTAAATEEARIEERLALLDRARALREGLLAKAGRDAAAPSPWGAALARPEDEIAALHRASFAAAVQRGLTGDGAIERLVLALAPELDRLEVLERRFVSLGLPTSTLRSKVARGDLRPLIARAFASADTSSREAIVEAAVRLEETLRTRGLGSAFVSADWLGWAVDVLARRRPAEGPASAPQLLGYRSLRKAEERAAVSLVLAELTLRVAPELRDPPKDAAVDLAAVRAVVAQLPEATRELAIEADLDRIDRAVRYLERWWAALSGPERSAGGSDPAGESSLSDFYQVVWDEFALTRFALEADLVASILPEAEGRATALSLRIAELERASHTRALEHLAAQGDAAWAATREPAASAS